VYNTFGIQPWFPSEVWVLSLTIFEECNKLVEVIRMLRTYIVSLPVYNNMSKKSTSHQSKLGANSLPLPAYGHEHFFHFHFDVNENQLDLNL
jgi:hypothetical protein